VSPPPEDSVGGFFVCAGLSEKKICAGRFSKKERVDASPTLSIHSRKIATPAVCGIVWAQHAAKGPDLLRLPSLLFPLLLNLPF
jgi:hypothetical protein